MNVADSPDNSASVVFSMVIRQFGTTDDFEVISHVPWMRSPDANDSRINVCNAFSKSSLGESAALSLGLIVIVDSGAQHRELAPQDVLLQAITLGEYINSVSFSRSAAEPAA